MTSKIIILLCGLLLLSYLFDLTTSKTKIPSVILLLILGGVVRQLVEFFEIKIPNLNPVLPVLGTVGLILIVLEGSLELELNKSKIPLIRKAFVGALLPILAISLVLVFIFVNVGGYGLRDSIINALPFCVISSAIAIPSVKNLSEYNKEFIIYESSLSDIIGVVLFNFFVENSKINLYAVNTFGFQLIIILVISFIASVALAFLLNKINHHIKFIPITLLIIMIYAISKYYHLPALLFILLFGLFIGNLDELKRFKWIEKLNPDELDKQVHKFKEITVEGVFLVRSLFFLLFGFLIESSEILNTDTILWAIVIVTVIYAFRALQLKFSNMPLQPLLFVAPRGLITILLFLSIEPFQQIPFVNNSLVIQVVLLTAILMMVGLVRAKGNDKVEHRT